MYFVHFLNKKLYMDTTRCLLFAKTTFEISFQNIYVLRSHHIFSQKGEFYSDFQTWKTIYTVEGSLSVFL